jgi:hypothetical protein
VWSGLSRARVEVVLGSIVGDLPPDSKIRPIFML